MACLGAKAYDPATAATFSTATAIAMTAMDTTNLRIAFTIPASGNVTVRIQCTVHGATTFPTILLGVLEGATLRGRVCPIGAIKGTALATTQVTQEAVYTLTGLTPGAVNWDAAYGVETAIAATAIKCGGPNDTTSDNAFGAVCFEVWEAENVLASLVYDPGTAVNKVTTAALAMTALDTTNLRIAFTTPASGRVLVRLSAPTHGATTFPMILLGILEGSTVIKRVSPISGIKTTNVATAMVMQEATFVLEGLSGAKTWDAAYGVEVLVASTGLKYGGPNNATANNAFGGFLFEIWKA